MYRVNAQCVDERTINVHYCYYTLYFKIEGFGALEMHFIIIKRHDVRIRARMRVLCV